MKFRLTALCVLALSVAGCDSADRRDDVPRQDWTFNRVDNTSKEAAFDAARYALSQWFTIRQSSVTDGVITTDPVEFEQRGGTERFRDEALKFRNRMRRRAVVRVRGGEGAAIVECVVTRERLDTADHRVFAMNRQSDDVGNQTPITQEGATSPAQNEVWTDVGRDRALERQILDVVRDRLAGVPAKSAPAAPAADANAAPPPTNDGQ